MLFYKNKLNIPMPKSGTCKPKFVNIALSLNKYPAIVYTQTPKP